MYGRVPFTAPRVSNIIELDPATGEHSVVYGNRPEQELLSIIRGKLELTEQGGWLITEHEAGRAIEVDRNGRVIWEYINRYDDEDVAEITEARLYAADYFEVDDWSCAQTAR